MPAVEQQPSVVESCPEPRQQVRRNPEPQFSHHRAGLDKLTEAELADLELELEAEAEVERAVARAEAAATERVGVFALQAAAALGDYSVEDNVRAADMSGEDSSPSHSGGSAHRSTSPNAKDLRLEEDVQLLQRALLDGAQSV